MTRNSPLGLDVGGANLKISDGAAYAASEFFPMWRESERLAERLATLLDRAPRAERLAVTMTGELADCFATKAEGVAFIVDATLAAAGGRKTRFYSQTRGFVDAEVAKATPLDVAAANWHATASWYGSFVPRGPALFLDAGSTTVDAIPLGDGLVAASGRTDTQRLLTGELVYTGVERTPLIALASSFVYRGQPCPVAAELFATTADAYVVLGRLPEDPSNRDTANGKPLARDECVRRLSRTLCADETEFDERDAIELATQAFETQARLVAAGIARVVERMSERPRELILAGHGRFLVLRALELAGLADVPARSLPGTSGEDAVSRAASAYALSRLAERIWPA